MKHARFARRKRFEERPPRGRPQSSRERRGRDPGLCGEGDNGVSAGFGKTGCCSFASSGSATSASESARATGRPRTRRWNRPH
ncbi:hypothetical protein CSUI_011302 [Cystoisospora suis]|uniref:Uncharacterized protein n=1 Tax=Cystoisospora suis TaxID=483139 RepID=A0A2C6KBR9_9APIC|nr:hypothetical protein CSUI_011302 [Cystoisospora suis]